MFPQVHHSRTRVPTHVWHFAASLRDAAGTTASTPQSSQ